MLDTLELSEKWLWGSHWRWEPNPGPSATALNSCNSWASSPGPKQTSLFFSAGNGTQDLHIKHVLHYQTFSSQHIYSNKQIKKTTFIIILNEEKVKINVTCHQVRSQSFKTTQWSKLIRFWLILLPDYLNMEANAVHNAVQGLRSQP